MTDLGFGYNEAPWWVHTVAFAFLIAPILTGLMAVPVVRSSKSYLRSSGYHSKSSSSRKIRLLGTRKQKVARAKRS